MPRSIRLGAAVCVAASLAAFPAMAADTTYEEPAELGARVDVATDLIIELGAGGRIAAAYEGSDEYEVSPFPVISLEYLNIPGLVEIGGGDGQGGGLSVGPSIGYTGERDDDDYDDLEGLDDVDATYEAGIRVGYEWTYAEVYGEARYAFGGAEGFVGDAGVNLIARPTPQIELKAGPVVSFASEDYTDTYFGVSAAEAIATGGRLDAYDPDGGLTSAGIATSARYEFRPDWFLNADASYNRIVGDAEDSPIVKVGSADQYTFGLGLSKRFSIDLF